MTQIVIMPGGFHPFHAGHYALYQSARRAFPKADVYVAATDDTTTRPFPFQVKEKLAQLAGVDKGRFMRVKSPFRAEEITAPYNPEKDVLIFVRSEKDADKPPQAGGVKRDGSPSYLQPLQGQTRYEPFAKHAYMAYLPTVEFGPGMTSATEIRTAWPTLNEKRKTALVMSLYPKTQGNAKLAATVVGLLDAAIGTQDVAEAAAPSQYAKLYHSTPLMSLDAILQSGYLAPTTKGYLSLTRDSKLDYGSWGGEFVEFDLDQNAVRQRIKLEPYVDLTTQTGARAAGRGESEERTRQKIPLKGFVTAMHAPTGWEGDKAGEHYGNLLKKYGVPIVYDIVPKLEEQGVAEDDNKCPPATQDITLNLENRQKAIDEYGYGPLNPDLPNTKFWMKKVDEWNLDSAEEAQQSLCGNCAAFDIRQETLDCIAQGIDSDAPEDAEGVIDAGDLGYCKFLKFKCASRRTCDAWVTGGPLQDKPVDENQGWAATLEEKNQGNLDADPELQQAKRFAVQHYPEFSDDPDMAFDKWVQRSLEHGLEDDQKQFKILQGVAEKIKQLEQAIAQARAQQSVVDESDYIEEKWSQKYKSSINCANPKGFSQKAHCAGRRK